MGTTAIGGFVTAQSIAAACTVAQVEAVNTVLATLNVPGDATILSVSCTTTDMDSGATLTIDVGDTDDDDRFITAVSGQAATTETWGYGAAVAPYTYSATGEQAIQATVKAAADTGVAGTVTVTVTYFRNA